VNYCRGQRVVEFEKCAGRTRKIERQNRVRFANQRRTASCIGQAQCEGDRRGTRLPTTKTKAREHSHTFVRHPVLEDKALSFGFVGFISCSMHDTCLDESASLVEDAGRD
jgi:hypothetical protein